MAKSEKWVAVHTNGYEEADRVVGIFESSEEATAYIDDEQRWYSDNWFAVRIERSEAEKWA